MKEKKKMIKLWSIILLFTIIINVLYFSFIVKTEHLWVISFIYLFLIWDAIAFVYWILSLFNIKYKKFTMNNNEIEIYAGFTKRYIKINGELKDEYKSSLTFTPINLSCNIDNNKINVVISPSNHITIKYNDELIK